MSIKLQNSFVNTALSGMQNVSFSGRKKEEFPKVDLTQKPDTVTFSSKVSMQKTTGLQEAVFSEIEKSVRRLVVDSAPTETTIKKIVKIICDAEKKGVEIDVRDLAKAFRRIAETPVKTKSSIIDLISGNKFQDTSHYYLMQRNLISMANIIDKTPQQENETTSAYLKRIKTLNSKRNKQLENGRISVIKSKLNYVKEKPEKEEIIELDSDELYALVDRLNYEIESDNYCYEKLSYDATIDEIAKTWKYFHVDGIRLTPKDRDLKNGIYAILMHLGRYDSSNPKETEDLGIVYNVNKDYKSEFKYEPVYRWLHIDNPDDFVKNHLPKNGEIYSYGGFQSCSTHKKFAEDDFNDGRSLLNVKFVFHPKSQKSYAYNTGVGQEVVYPPYTEFKVLDKTLVEDVIYPNNKEEEPYSVCRWEVHMQEV